MGHKHKFIVTKWYEYKEEVDERETTIKVAKELHCSECELSKNINESY